MNAKINDSIQIKPRGKKSFNRLSLNSNNLDLKSNLSIRKSSRKNTRLDKSIRIDKNTRIDKITRIEKNTRLDKYTKIDKNSNLLLLDNGKQRRKSFQPTNNNYKRVKEEIDKDKGHKAKTKKKAYF